MSDTPRTDLAQHNMGSIVDPHYVVDADFSRYLERELAEANARLDWLDTVPCGIFHKGYGEYRYYIGDGFTKKAREVIDAAMKEVK